MTAPEETAAAVVPAGHPIPGWVRPVWASRVSMDDLNVIFERAATVLPLQLSDHAGEPPVPTEVTLVQYSRLNLNVAEGTIAVDEDELYLHLFEHEIAAREARRSLLRWARLRNAYDRSAS